MLGISFVDNLKDFHSFKAFNNDVIDLIRNNLKAKVVVVIDRGWGLPGSDGFLVKDHINLTGNNPLLGANPACGPRFFKMTDLYISDTAGFPEIMTAGLKAGIHPNADELAAMKKLGIECWSYNLVPTSIVAAHAGLKVLGILVPNEGTISETIRTKILSLGDKY